MCGFSMGGVHASMVSSLYPKRIATTSLLAPRSASVSFCYGALRDATAWQSLTSTKDNHHQDVLATVQAAAKSTAVTHAASRVKIDDLLRTASHGRESYESSPSGPEEMAESAQLIADEWKSASEKSPGLGSSGRMAASSAGAPTGPLAYSLGRRLPWWVQRGGGAVMNAVDSVSSRFPWDSGDSEEFELARQRLEQVLETFTDVTRFPCPKAPEAAVLVGALEDAYVSRESIRELAAHWPGCEVRWLPGGHVSAFLMQQSAFRKAVVDSITRL